MFCLEIKVYKLNATDVFERIYIEIVGIYKLEPASRNRWSTPKQVTMGGTRVAKGILKYFEYCEACKH